MIFIPIRDQLISNSMINKIILAPLKTKVLTLILQILLMHILKVNIYNLSTKFNLFSEYLVKNLIRNIFNLFVSLHY
jgi:hypothetical protein